MILTNALKKNAVPLALMVLSGLAAATLWLWFLGVGPEAVPPSSGPGYEAVRANVLLSTLFFGVILLMAVLFPVMRMLDPNRARYAEFAQAYVTIKSACFATFLVLQIVFALRAFGVAVDPLKIIPAVIGVLLLCIGNFLGKVRRNHTVGVRLPWTLASEDIWNRTNRLCGWILIIFGLLLLVSTFLPSAFSAGVAVLGVAATVVLPTVYAWRLSRRLRDPRVSA